jgi:UDP-N-acetylglucosamine 4,6-dehydratase/5-epimerase
MMNKKILIFGGTGSLGNKLIERHVKNNKIINFSRDECKHWKLEQKFINYINKIENIIGDIRSKKRVKETIKLINPDIIIIASALKHIDRCEYASSECINTNIIGIQNILDAISELDNLNCKNVVFISTDKACSPVNLYGMCKAISEKMIIEKAKNAKNIKYNIVRYGNVLNSRGSIIPFLHNLGKNKKNSHFTLTDERMTRFIMTLEESCKLIEYTIENGQNGEVIIPSIKSMKVKDMFEIFSEIYKKPIKITGLRPGEKLYESLINGTQHLCTYINNDYFHIQPTFYKKLLNKEQKDINSNFNLLSKEKLKKLLLDLNLIEEQKKNDENFVATAYELGC